MQKETYIQKDRADLLLEKWQKILDYKSPSIKEITNENVRLNTAICLENQEKWCFENTAGNGGSLGSFSTAGQGDMYAPGDARLPKILIPMIRRTFPELITNDIVGVQPMGGPVGLAFALRYRYNDEGLGIGGADRGTPNADGGLPTKDTIDPNPHTTPSVADDGTDKRELGYQHLDSRFTGVESTALSGSDDWKFSNQDRGVAEILANFEIQNNVPQVNVTFDKTAVQAGTRRLGARWSVELEQDLKNMNGIDVDAEITNAMSYEIQAEIDREMIMRMCQSALNAGVGKGYSFWSPKTADARYLAERNRDFYQRLIIEANRIAVRNRRGAANFIVATPRVCAILEMLPEFQWMSVSGDVDTQPVGVAKVGSVGGRFNVYRDTRTEVQSTSTYGDQGYTPDAAKGVGRGQATYGDGTVEYALLGYKGVEFYDTGIIYCPYIPIMVQRTIGPNDMAPRVGLMTRYGVVDNIFGSDLYYHIILVNDLNTEFVPGEQSVYF